MIQEVDPNSQEVDPNSQEVDLISQNKSEWVTAIELYIRTRGAHWPIYVARHAGMRPFCKLTKQHRVAFIKHKLQRQLHIQRACRMARVSPCAPAAFVVAASPMRPLVLI